MTSGHSYVLARWNRGNSKACISERVWLATSRPLISYEYFILKSFFILNKFQLFLEFLKSPLREQMSWRQSKNWVRRYTLDKRGWPFSLLSKHWFWLWHGAREISFNVVSYLCCKEKTDYTSSISQKHLMGVGKHTENKEIYPCFKKSGDSGLWKDNDICH